MGVEKNADIRTDEESFGEYALPDGITYTLTGLHIMIVGISIIRNIMIVVLFLTKKITKTNANCFLMAMAVSDVLLVLWCEPFTVFGNLINYHWIFGSFMCSAVSFIQTSCVIQRSCTLVASSLDRYHAIRWPLKKQMPRSVVISIIIAIWFVSLLLPVPVAVFSQIVFFDYENVSGICLEVWPNDDLRQAFSITLLLLTYIIPLLVLSATYRHIILILQKKPPGEEYDQLLRKRREVRRKTIQVFLLVFCSYAVCWLPIHVMTIIGDRNPEIYDSKTVHIMWVFAQCLAVSNSAVSPIIVLTHMKRNKLRPQLRDKFGSAMSNRRASESPLQDSVLLRKMKRFTQLSFSPSVLPETKAQRRITNSCSSYSWRRNICSEQTLPFPSGMRRNNTQETYF